MRPDRSARSRSWRTSRTMRPTAGISCSSRCLRSTAMRYPAARCCIVWRAEVGTASMTHPPYEPTLDCARRLDEADPLRALRERFALPRGGNAEPLVYLCGHSLGLMPLAARGLVMEELDDWARLAVLGH